jgi:hypothetical protein
MTFSIPAGVSEDKAVEMAQSRVAAGLCSEDEAQAALDAYDKGKTPSPKPPAKPKMSKDEVLAKLAAKEITLEEASKLLDDVPQGNLRCKVSEKGGVSLYGVNSRMPVTLYADQWARVLAFSEDIKGFIARHKSELKFKNAG